MKMLRLLIPVFAIPLIASAATEACPRWISVLPLAEDDEEGIAADAVAQGNETFVDGIAWIASIHPQGNPAADLASGYASAYRRIEPLVRARSGVRQGILLQSTMGHGGFPGEETPWQHCVRPDGKIVYRMCPLDGRFLDYIARSCRTLAALKPDFIMVDDDTRLVWGDAPGCFCPRHLAALEKATGRRWTREEAVARVKAGDAAVASVWERINVDSLSGLFRTIRANCGAGTPGILCAARTPFHFRHAVDFARILAAPGQVPVIRGSGGNYCGNDVYHPVEMRAVWAGQLREIGPDAVLLQEADTCPQLLTSCSATRAYENMVLLALEGVKGAKIWITRTVQTRERRSQVAYRRILSENRGILDWAAKTDFRATGVVVPHARASAGFAERYLALMGIPYRFGDAAKGEVTALCAETLAQLDRAAIERIFSGNVLLDATGANWMAKNGFADLTGVEARPWARRTVQRHLDENGADLGGMRVDGKFADLSAVRPGAEILSRLCNVPSRGAAPQYEAPGAVAYGNARGGRVISIALPLRSAMPTYYNQVLFGEGYQAWIVRLLERLGGRFAARFAGTGPVLCEVGRTSAEGDVFVLDPLDFDDLVEPEMAFARTPVAIERLQADGTWKAVRFAAEPTGFVRLKDTVRAKRPTVYRFQCPGVARIVSAPDDRYCGWPTVTRTGRDELTVVFSGNREGHICPYGQIRRIRSTDGGRTWGRSDILEDGILDDRDAGLLKLANGDLVLFWFTSTAYCDFYKMWEKDLARRQKTYPYLANLKADYVTHCEKLDPAAVRAALGGFAKRSTDGGRTWGEKARFPFASTHTPHGGIELRDGRLMFVGDDRRVAVSSDAGRTWSVLAQLPKPPPPAEPGARKLGFTEPCLLEGADGVLRCYIRDREALLSESADGGKTWSVPVPTGIAAWGSPLHALRLADGRYLLTTARRNGAPGCIFALLGDRNGTAKSFESSGEIVLAEQKGSDFGYASTAQNADGSLVTVYYAHPVDERDKAALYAVRWSLPDPSRLSRSFDGF